MNKSWLLPIFLIVVVDVLGLTIVIPFLPFYAQKFGATPFVVGLLITSYAFFQLVSGPVLGQLSDRIGRRPVLLFSQIGTLIGFVVLARAHSLWLIFLSRIIDGSTAGNLSVAQAYISDVTEPEHRAKAFGLIGIAFGIGFLIGPAFSGWLSQFGFNWPVYAAVALSACSIVATWFFLPDTRSLRTEAAPERRLSPFQWSHYFRFFKDPVLSKLLLQFFAFALSFSLFFSGFALFAERRFVRNGMPFGPMEVGYVYAYTGFLGIVLQGGFVGRLVTRFGEKRLAAAGFFASALGYAILGYVGTIPGLLIAATVSSFGSGTLRPTLTSLISKCTPRNRQGMIMGLTQSLNSVSQILAPLLAGFLIGHGWLSAWAVCAAAVAAAGLLMILRFRAHVSPSARR